MNTTMQPCLILILFAVTQVACTYTAHTDKPANKNAPPYAQVSTIATPNGASTPISTDHFFEQTMNAAPFLPQDQSTQQISCDLAQSNSNTHTTSQTANYSDYGWEQRIAHDWSFFDSSAEQGKILLIDITTQNNLPAYRYLANDNTHSERYEPWSSSKIFAFTGAIAKLRKDHISLDKHTDQNDMRVAQGRVGQYHIADLITSINSYEAFSKADGNSNAIATFFTNLATREYLSALFYNEWLKLSTPNIYFKGAYGPVAFEPDEYLWRSPNNANKVAITMNNIASQDPYYLSYRCQDCGLTGNKPMTTLAQAEWLKRLAMHSEDPATAHPFLTQSDVNTLFYGEGHSQAPEQFAGMTLGISTMLQQAIAKNISDTNIPMTPQLAKTILDKATNGQWRIFQKIGWGPSETRSTSETVVLAYVCLPYYVGKTMSKSAHNYTDNSTGKNADHNHSSTSTNGNETGRAFVIAAQIALPEAKDENVALAGLQMQTLLERSLAQYFNTF